MDGPAYQGKMDARPYEVTDSSIFEPKCWGAACHAFYNEETLLLEKKLLKVKSAMAHKPFHPSSESHQAFVQNQLNHIKSLDKNI